MSAYADIADEININPIKNDTTIFEETFDYSDFRSDFVAKVIETEEDGKKVLSYPMSAEKVFSSGNPTSLGIVVYSYFDPTALLRAHPDLNDFAEQNLQSRRDSLLILDGGQISSTTSVFTDLGGEVWTGPIQQMNETKVRDMLGLDTVSSDRLEGVLNAYLLAIGAYNRFRINATNAQPDDLLLAQWISEWLLENKSTISTDIDWVNLITPTHTPPTTPDYFMKRNPSMGYLGSLSFALTLRRNNVGMIPPNFTWEWATGRVPGPLGIIKPLNKTMVSDPKVQDFRKRDEILEIQYDFTSTINDIFANLQKNLRGDRIDIPETSNYFSDMFLSRDYYDNCRYFFTMNWKRILIDNSFFGKLFDNVWASVDDLLFQSKINEFRIIRKRFDGSPEIGSKPKSKPFDENEIPEVVVLTKDSENELFNVPLAGQIVDVTQNENSLSEQMAKIQYVDPFTKSASRHRAIANFTGIDGGIAAVTDGYYYYGIELDILDGSVEIVRRWLKSLLSHIEDVKIYYDDAIAAAPRSNAGANETPQYSPYIDVPGEGQFEPGERRLGMNFNVATNRFSRDFIEKWTTSTSNFKVLKTTFDPRTVYGTTTSRSLRGAITDTNSFDPGYIEILKYFSGNNLSQAEVLNLSNTLLDYLNPNSGTPDSIGVVVKLMETLAGKIESILGTVPMREFAPGATLFTKKASNWAVRERSFKIQHDFSSIFNANLPNKLGFDFLNLAKSPYPGLCQISSNDFRSMITTERAKIFNDGTQPITWVGNANARIPAGNDNTTAGTYFTPTTVFLPDEDDSGILFNGTATARDYLKPLSWSLYGKRTSINMISALGSTTVRGANVAEQMVLANDLSSYFSNYHSTAIVTPRNNLEKAYSDVSAGSPSLGSDFQKAIYSEVKHGRDMAYEFFLRIIQQAKFSQDNKRRMPAPGLPVPAGSYDLNDQASLIVQGIRAEAPTTGMLGILLDHSPPQIKSLMYINTAFQTAVTDYTPASSHLFVNTMLNTTNMMENPSSYAEFIFKTQMINQVEVLAGYERSGEDLLLKKPIWMKMKSPVSDVRNLLDPHENILCRQVPYTNSTLKVGRNENFELPTYGEFFLYFP